MDIQPIFAALRKHRIPAALIVLEIALACAVLCNAVFMIGQRVSEIHIQNAIDESGIVDIGVQGINPDNANADIPAYLAALREIPGVTAVTEINMMPLGNSSWNTNVATSPGDVTAKDSPNVAEYMFTKGGPEALGLRLLQGRLFNDDEYADSKLGDSYMPSSHVVVVTQSLARRLWPGQNALGKQIWQGKKNTYTVIGVVADVLRPDSNGGGVAHFHWSMFFPVSPALGIQEFVVRSAPQDRDRIVRDGVQKLEELSPSVVVKGQTFSDIRDKYFANTRSMVWMLVLVCVVMLAVTAFGIVGLTSFWV
ncbi:MAG TPA: ABC transporter permease, partial [Rhodanobacter sp.]|nr:ABC transporter permease [Rhodanobacter sp.]